MFSSQKYEEISLTALGSMGFVVCILYTSLKGCTEVSDHLSKTMFFMLFVSCFLQKLPQYLEV